MLEECTDQDCIHTQHVKLRSKIRKKKKGCQQPAIYLCVCVYMCKLVQQSQLTLNLIAKLSKFGVKYFLLKWIFMPQGVNAPSMNDCFLSI